MRNPAGFAGVSMVGKLADWLLNSSQTAGPQACVAFLTSPLLPEGRGLMSLAQQPRLAKRRALVRQLPSLVLKDVKIAV